MNAKFQPGNAKSPTTIAPISLGTNGIAFMRNTLSENGTLAAAVAQLFGAGGSAFALLPVGTTLERASAFDQGGMMKMGTPHKWLADYIASRYGSKGCQLIFADPWIETRDVHPDRLRNPSFFNGPWVFYAPDSSDIYAALNAGMLESRGFLSLGFVISPKVSLPSSWVEVDSAFIDRLASNTQTVFASTYDQESYVVWEKT